MGRTPRAAAAAILSERAAGILPRVVSEATASGVAEHDAPEMQRRLTAFLDRSIPAWVEALRADDSARPDAISRLLDIDNEVAASERIPPVVLLGTVAITYRALEAEIRQADPDGFSADEIWAEVDLLRRSVGAMRRENSGGGRVV